MAVARLCRTRSQVVALPTFGGGGSDGSDGSDRDHRELMLATGWRQGLGTYACLVADSKVV